MRNECHLPDRIRALALLLSQRNDERAVPAKIVAHARAEAPFVSEPESNVRFDGSRLQPLVFDSLIAFRREAKPICHRDSEGSAKEARLPDRRLAWCRVAGVEILRIEVDAPIAPMEEDR